MPGSDAHAPTPRLVGTDADLPPEHEFDDLAELFLGSAGPNAERDLEPDDHPGAAATAERTVEAVILGHLPVRAGLWVHQYARRRAELSNAPVAVVRARSGECGVSLVNGPKPHAEHPSLEAALRHAGSVAPTTVLEVGELDEPALAEQAGIDAVTILSGADEAAAVAAYRAAKRFTDAASERDGPTPSVRVAIVGADAERTRAAADRIERASRAFLTGPLEVIQCGTKIGGPAAREIFHGPTDDAPDQLIEWLRAPAPIVEPELTTEPKPASHPNAIAAAARRAPEAHPAPRQETDPTLQEPMDETFATQAARAHAAAQSTPTPAPTSEHAPATAPTHKPTPVDKREPESSSIPGLRVLPGHCPHAAGVRLAGDELGGLHLVAIERRGGAIEPGHAAERLAAAAAWAKLNAELLKQAIGIADATRAASHIVTDDPARVRGLLDSEIRVHLAIEVPGVEGKPVTVCRALN